MPRRLQEELESCILELHALSHGPEFITGVMHVLRRLVPSTFALYGITDLDDAISVFGRRYPEEIDAPRWVPIFNAHFWEHPLNAQARLVTPGAVVTMPQLMRDKRWGMTANFNEFCRPNGIEYQLMLRLPSKDGVMDAVGVARSDRDYTEAERWCLEKLKTHVLVAHRRAQALAMHGGPVLSELENWQVGHALIDARARALFVTSRAERLFARFFRARGPHGQVVGIPEELRAWARAQLRALPASPPRELVCEAGTGASRSRLRAWLVPNTAQGRHDIYLEERAPEDVATVSSARGSAASIPAAAELAAQVARVSERWGLSQRQRAVLALIAQGHSNKEVAAKLGCVEGTVEYHVTGLLRRAGAGSRTALLSRFWHE